MILPHIKKNYYRNGYGDCATDRERFTLLQVNHKETNRKDEAGSGTSRQVI